MLRRKKTELLKRRLLCFSNDCLRENPGKCHHRILKQVYSKTKCPVWSGGKSTLKKLCINSQFGYCAQVWINRSRNHERNRIHEKAPRFYFEILL